MRTEHVSLLVVDDERRNRTLLSARLESCGYTVTAVENGRQALEMIQVQAFDLVLLDLLMPEMDGYQVLAHLKADPALHHLPVIVISALEDVDSVVRCIEMGAEDYLPKPFNPVLLQARVSACLEKKRLHDQEKAYLRQLKAFNETLEQRVHEATSTIRDYTQLLERRLREMAAMSDVSLALSSVMDVDAVLEMIMEKSKEVMHAEASSLLMLDVSTGKLRFQVAKGAAGTALRSATVDLGHGIAGWVAQTGEPLLISDAYQDPRFDPSFDEKSGFRTRSILTVPLKAKTEVTGVVQVINKFDQDTFDEHDLELFHSFASQASVALENARLYERTRAMAEDLREALEKERWLAIEKQKMGAYMPKHVVDDISRNREQKLALGGKTERLTILFADIQGFTRLSESMEPQRVVSFLNVYMTAMTGIIEAEQGIIDKFIGDGIMAIFTRQGEDDNHALRAVRSGLRMQQKLGELRNDWKRYRPELAALQIRIGINTGEVVAGNIGSETRMDYTVVGDNVNVAARIESVCRAGEVYISESTYLDVRDAVAATKMEPISVKNRVQPVQTYAVRKSFIDEHDGVAIEV
jgi:class 3 adenylate cyclase/CheY-like chemotaxis protein